VRHLRNIELCRIILQKNIFSEVWLKFPNEIIVQLYDETKDVFDLLDCRSKAYEVTQGNAATHRICSEFPDSKQKRKLKRLNKEGTFLQDPTKLDRSNFGVGTWFNNMHVQVWVQNSIYFNHGKKCCCRGYSKVVFFFLLRNICKKLLTRLILSKVKTYLQKNSGKWEQLNVKVKTLGESTIIYDIRLSWFTRKGDDYVSVRNCKIMIST
jgi:hypothetical protein